MFLNVCFLVSGGLKVKGFVVSIVRMSGFCSCLMLFAEHRLHMPSSSVKTMAKGVIRFM